MEYNTRTVRSRPGMSQEQALASLQNHPHFRSGTRISAIRRRGEVWVADLLEPRTAEFPPPSGEKDEESGPPSGKPPFGDDPSSDGPDSGSDDSSSSDDSESSDSESSDPFGGGEDGPPKPDEEKGGKGGGDQEIVHLLTEILHALGGGAPEPGLGGPDHLGPGGGPDAGGPPAPAPPHGGPGAAGGAGAGGGAGGMGRSLKPGEMRNTPGSTPVGAPAFSSTRTALGEMPGGPGAGAPGMAPGGPAPQGPCPTCGMPKPCACDAAGAGGVPTSAPPAGGAVASTFVAERPANVSIKRAKAELAGEFGPRGYTVRQIKRANGKLSALLSRR